MTPWSEPISHPMDRSFHVEHKQETLANCPLCGSPETRVSLTLHDHSISHEDFSTHDCDGCGFRFTNPRPTPSAIGDYYKDSNYISHNSSGKGFLEHLYRIARKRALRRKAALIREYVGDGRALDIGCGTGEFLAQLMSRGFQVTGIEPDLGARERAISNFSIPVFPALEQIPAQEQFRVITLWHALEHVPDPKGTFKTLYALLEPGGLLVIAVPDRESWDRSYYNSYWAAWDVPRHLSHFRRMDVHRLIHEHGFEILDTRRMPLDAFYIALLSEGYRGSHAIWRYPKAMAIGLWSNLSSFLSNRPTSSTLFIAKKPNR